MNWFTSDLHFGHEGVLTYCRRPFSDLEHMHFALIRHWNQRVSPYDTVFVIGDLALCPFKEFEPLAAQLQGKKVLIKGNHDHYSIAQYRRLGFEVYEELKMRLAGHKVRLSHFPYWPKWYRRPFVYKSELRYPELRPPRVKGEILIHGHTHTKWKRLGNRIHVGVDAWNYFPVSQREIEGLIARGKDE